MATIELYLVRHGLAAERGDDYPDDAKRPRFADDAAKALVACLPLEHARRLARAAHPLLVTRSKKR